MINEEFDKYMERFKTKSLKEKQSIALNQAKMLVGLVKQMCESKGIKSDIFLNRELIDTNLDNYTDDDYIESLIVYINSIQNMLCDYNIQLSTRENQ